MNLVQLQITEIMTLHSIPRGALNRQLEQLQSATIILYINDNNDMIVHILVM